jgi:hypothetical protein
MAVLHYPLILRMTRKFLVNIVWSHSKASQSEAPTNSVVMPWNDHKL